MSRVPKRGLSEAELDMVGLSPIFQCPTGRLSSRDEKDTQKVGQESQPKLLCLIILGYQYSGDVPVSLTMAIGLFSS